MYGIYANIGGILMVKVTIYSIHGSYGLYYAYYANGNSNLMLSYVAAAFLTLPVPMEQQLSPCLGSGTVQCGVQ